VETETAATKKNNATPISNEQLASAEVDAIAINAAEASEKAASNSSRQFLFHVTYDASANANKKYKAEDLSKEEQKLNEIFGTIREGKDSKKHFIIHVTYDATTKQYVPANMTEDPNGTYEIFIKINPDKSGNNIKKLFTNVTPRTPISEEASSGIITPAEQNKSQELANNAYRQQINQVIKSGNPIEIQTELTSLNRANKNASPQEKNKIQEFKKQLQNALDKAAPAPAPSAPLLVKQSSDVEPFKVDSPTISPTTAKTTVVPNVPNSPKVELVAAAPANKRGLAIIPNKSEPRELNIKQSNLNGGTRRKQKKAKTQKRKQRR
jgi:type II secretory pathway pseudopilin PulG